MKKDRIKVLPDVVDNKYRGNPIARCVYLLLVMVTIGRSLIHIFAPDGGAQSIATIPLDTYSSAGAATVVLIFSLWGLSQLLMSVVYMVVYVKYKSLISAMYVLLVIEYAMRIVIGMLKPIVTVGTAPGGAIGSLIMLAICTIMLVLSLIRYEDDIEEVVNGED